MTRRAATVRTAFFLVLLAGAGYLAAGLRSDSSATLFLRHDDPVRRSYARFVESFGPDTFVLVTCRGDGTRAFHARVRALARALAASPAVAGVDLAAPGSPVARGLRLASADERRLSLPVRLAGPPRAALDAVEGTLARFPDLAPRTAGQPVLNLALKEASDSVGQRLLPFLALAMTLLVVLAYRSARVMVVVLLVTALSVVVGMALVALSGRPINLITIVLPVLLLALTVALCIHLVNSYRLHRVAGRPVAEAVRAMQREEFRPCLLTTLTTAAGFGFFGLSRIEPLRVLGVTMALSILAAFAISYLLLPALLVLLRPRPREGLRIGEALVRAVPPIVRRPRAVLGAFALLVAGGLAAAPLIPRETNAMRYLAPTHPLRAESERLAADGVGTASVEIVLRAPPGQPLTDLAAPLRELETRLLAWRDEPASPVRGVLTPLTLAREGAFRMGLPPAPALEGAALTAATGDAEERLARFRDIDRGAARVSVRVDATDVETFHAVRARLEALVARAVRGIPGTSFELTGQLPIVMTVQEELLTTLLLSLAGTVATIYGLLALATRSPRLAALTLLPGAAPLAFVLIACAAAGVPLSISTVLVLAVTLGVVTDDSVHMLHALRHRRRKLTETLRRVGTAVTETSIAILMGFAVLGGADFVPTRDFGLLTAGAMVFALAADVILFPVLLWRRGTAGAIHRAYAPWAAVAPEEATL